jgi:hypothetical protein
MGILPCCPKRDPKLARLITSNAVIAPTPIVDPLQPLLLPHAEPFRPVSKDPLVPPGDSPAEDRVIVSIPEEEEEEEEFPKPSPRPSH